MFRSKLALLAVAAIVATALACGHSSPNPASPSAVSASSSGAAAEGEPTLKATAPTPVSPINGEELKWSAQQMLSASPATAKFVSVDLQYRFQIMNGGGTLLKDSGIVDEPIFTITSTDLPVNAQLTWRVRAEYEGAFGPWSETASFRTPNEGYLNKQASEFFDPLTNEKTVGKRRGGSFVKGQGWRADGLSDGIDYDIATCSSCRLEFDVTGVGRKQGEMFQKDLKWISMGDANAFGDFSAFRNHPWKMHLEQRSDGDGTAMKIVWRNGAAGDGEPGDHVQFIPNRNGGGPDWEDNQVFHFILEWNPSGFKLIINGKEWYHDGFGGHAYRPGNHRISLGCYPRGETMKWAIFRNVSLTPQ